MANSKNARNVVLNMLSETLQGGVLSSRAISSLFENKALSLKDRNFALSLYLGVLERLPLLDYNIAAYSNISFRKIKPSVRYILEEALYQMFFMDYVPDRAALSEALKLLDLRQMSSLKGFVNGVLRTIQKEGLKNDAPDYISACVSEWIYTKVNEDIGKENADKFFAASINKKDGLYVSLNGLRSSKEEIIKSLEDDGCKVKETHFSDVLKIKPLKSFEELKAFKEGLIYAQSPNSGYVSRAAKELLCKKDPFIMDICAAPGGKSINLSFAFPEAVILSSDKSEKKVSLLDQNIKRLKLNNINTRIYDGLLFDEAYAKKADLVVVDAPCSGLGVISQKPDIKYRLKKEDISSLCALQREILMTSSGYVKDKGLLIYSTCTLTKEENEQNALWFESETSFKLIKSSRYLTFEDTADGFYVSAFTKN